MKPLVSIITPTYNHALFIAECIDSVLKQTYDNWELIVVDDASKDATCEIVEQYLHRDKRISLIRHVNNYGPSRLFETHNEALAMSKGEYVCVLEGDDYWPGYRLQMQLDSFSEKSVLSHGLTTVVSDGVGQVFPYRFSNAIKYNEPIGSALKAFILATNPLGAQSVMVKKSILEKIGGFTQIPSLYLVDYPTWMQFALEGRFSFVNCTLGYWRRHANSITMNHEETLWNGFLCFVREFLKDKDDDIEKLPCDLKIYTNNYGYNAYMSLAKLKLLNGDSNKATALLKDEIWKRKQVLPLLGINELAKLLCLFSSCYISPAVYRIIEKYFDKFTARRDV